MRFVIAAVGRLKDGAERSLLDRYLERLKAGVAIQLGPLEIREIPESRQAAASSRRVDEAERLLRAAGSADLRIALDEAGASLTSIGFARMLGQRRDEGIERLAFLIGGPDGHGKAVLDAARSTLSLGPMTLPHGLARVLLAEQLYRAVTILTGHPYHRG